MIAAILTEINKPLELHSVRPLFVEQRSPSYPHYGQVLVRVIASGICGAQLQEIRGEKGNHFPRLIGHEGCGIVEQVGANVSKVKVGDKVVMHWRKGEGIECQSPGYMLEDKYITGGQVVTFATHSVCSENRLTPVPKNTPVDFCALLGCGLSTALGTIEQEANLKMGESILVIGCGGLGLNLIRAASLRRAGEIGGIDIHESKRMSTMLAGASFFGTSFPQKTWDVVIDTTGFHGAIEQGIEHLAPSGRFIMVGQPSGYMHIRNGKKLFDGEGCSIKATQGGGFRPSADIPRYVKLYESGQLNLEGIISHRLPFEKINDGLELVKNGQAGRVLIEMP